MLRANAARMLALAPVLLCHLSRAPVLAQVAPTTPQDSTASDEPRPVTPPDAPQPGPKFLDLRYDDDFTYLDGEPGTYQADLFDPVKRIRLDDRWRLTLGVEFRYRLEAETDKTFGAGRPSQDTFHLFRYLLHADVRYGNLFRIFVQGASMFDENRDRPLRPIDENRWDLHQLFADLRFLGEHHPLTLRLGRQELGYGAERLVSPFEWGNIRRRFDAAKLFTRNADWRINLWFARPVVVQRKQRDRFDEDVDFYGLYTTYAGIERHGLDLYFLALLDRGNRISPNARAGDRNVYTLGTRFWGTTAGLDYETELSGQWGHWAGDTVQAWSWAIDGGYTFRNAPGAPRIGAGFDLATGDDDPTDSSIGTFDQLFPLGHKYFGYLDLVGRQNITAANVNLSAWPVPEKVKAAAAFHAFWLTERRDALYDAGGTALRRDPTGRSGREIGQELDLTLTLRLNVHASLLLGYSHLWSGNFIRRTGASEDPDLFYVQYAFKF